MTTQACKALVIFLLILLSCISALKACHVSQWADIYRFKAAVRLCILDTSLKDPSAPSIQAAIDVLSEEVATCLDQKMRAEGYPNRGIFVGDQYKTTQNFGNGLAFIVTRPLDPQQFTALPQGSQNDLRIVYSPAAPTAPQSPS